MTETTDDLRARIVAAIRRAPFKELRTVDYANGPLQITANVDDLAEAVLAAGLPAPADLADLRRKLASSERIRENADFHLGQEMARRQLAEKETARLRAVVARLRQMTDHWEQQLPEVIRTPAVVSAIRAVLEAAEAVPSAPADGAAILREAAADLTARTLLADDCACADLLRRMADEAQQPVCPTSESHNWGCGCPGDRLPLYSDRGVDTPGCDCGHTGMGMRWHDGVGCAWFKRLTEEGRRLLVDDPADEAQQPERQARLAAYQTCGVCKSGYPTGGSCGTCAFNARMAAEARPVFELPGPEVVAYRNSVRPGVLLCREHGDGWWGLTPLTSDDLPDGGTCTYGDPADPGDVCGRDVLIAEARQADTAGEQQ